MKQKQIRIQGPCSQGRGAILNYEMPSDCILATLWTCDEKKGHVNNAYDSI